jgi:hypothetical protein
MNHLVEWQKSCVDEQLTNLNVRELEGLTVSDYLLYSEELPRRNDGRVTKNILKRYEHTTLGGWWCSGVDLLTGDNDNWGCFKPNNPRPSLDGRKTIKYEHPPKTPTGIFALRVPEHIWERIAANLGIPIIAAENREPQDFWAWVLANPKIPVCITEGAKKAGALLTAGYAAIALPGIHNGYRTPKDEQGNRVGKSHLIPPLEKLAEGGREIYIVFDQDSQPTTQVAVNQAIRQMGYLLIQAGCSVKVVSWETSLGKGVDDLIANQGSQAFSQAYENALSLELWKAKNLSRLSYSPNISLCDRFLGAPTLPPEAQLIGIKSPKGTGKTHFLAQVVKEARQQQQKVLVLGHRVRLVEELCRRFNLDYISAIKDNPQAQSLGYGLCVDSLHPHSQAQFQACDWYGSLVIIDEVEQVLWHALNSDTCKHNRVEILKSLKALIQNVCSSGGRVLIADADLSDISLEYLISLSGVPLQPFIIQNYWKPSPQEAYKVYHYPETTPKCLAKNLVKHIRAGGKPFICLSAQKLTSQWGTLTLESYLTAQFPEAKILRIDAESLADASHPAYQAMGDFNSSLREYDIVLASPVLETGISLEIREHFTSVWCIAQGIQTPTSICQSLSRIRANIPRHIWIAGYGFNYIGNGSTSIPTLLASGHRLTDLNIRLLQQSDLESLDDIDTGFQAESLLCWAKMAVRVNAGMLNYRDAVLSILREEGQQIRIKTIVEEDIEAEERKQSHLTEAINAVRKQNYQQECLAIAQASLLSEEEYQKLKKRLVKTTPERRILRNYDLKKRYCIPVTPELVQKDDQGWYQQLRLNYFLTIGREFLSDRDTLIARKLIESGHGSLFIPDFNGSQLGAIIGTMEVLGIPVLLSYPQRKLKNNDSDLQKLASLAIHNRSEIKAITKIGLAKTSSPITVAKRFLDLLGFNLTLIGTSKEGKKNIRIYQIFPPDDGREEVFAQWLLKDQQHPGSSEIWYSEYLLGIGILPGEPQPENNPCFQLSLDLGVD